jgi:hypothetical protein
MSEYDNDQLCSLRAALLDHPVYTQVVSVADLRRFMEDHVCVVWGFMSLLKRLQQDRMCISNDIVIGEEKMSVPTDPMSATSLSTSAHVDIGASTRVRVKFRSLVFVGLPVELALARIGAPLHAQALLRIRRRWPIRARRKRSWRLFYGREDIIPEMRSAGFSIRFTARSMTTIACVISSTTSIGASNSTATVMARKGVSC